MVVRALVVLLVSLAFPLLLWGLLYFLMRRELGRRATHRTLKLSLLIGLPSGLVGAVVGIVLTQQHIGVSTRGELAFAYFLLISLVFWWYALRWQGQRRRAGALLFDIGWRRSRKLLFLISIVPAGVAAVLFLSLAIVHGGKQTLYDLGFAYGMLALTAFMIFNWRTGVQLREHGILMTKLFT